MLLSLHCYSKAGEALSATKDRIGRLSAVEGMHTCLKGNDVNMISENKGTPQQAITRTQDFVLPEKLSLWLERWSLSPGVCLQDPDLGTSEVEGHMALCKAVIQRSSNSDSACFRKNLISYLQCIGKEEPKHSIWGGFSFRKPVLQ